MKTLSHNGRTFPLEVAVAHSVALWKQCVQESRAQGVATMQRQREQSLARAAGTQYMSRPLAPICSRYRTSDIVSYIASDSDLNPDIGVPDIVSDIDTNIGNVMPDIKVLNYDIGAPLISVLILEAWCSNIRVYPI